MQTTRPNFWAYYRRSSGERKQSFTSQMYYVEECVAANNATLTREFVDTAPAVAFRERIGWNAMLEACLALPITERPLSIVVANYSRLARSDEGNDKVKDFVRRSRVSIILADQNKPGGKLISPNYSEMEWFILNVESMVAAQYRTNLSSAIRGALAAKSARGEKLGPKYFDLRPDQIRRLYFMHRKRSIKSRAEDLGVKPQALSTWLKTENLDLRYRELEE